LADAIPRTCMQTRMTCIDAHKETMAAHTHTGKADKKID
jgi:hypothetical protein